MIVHGRIRGKLVLLHVSDICSLAEVAPVTAGLDPLPLLREFAHKCMGKLKAVVPDSETLIREHTIMAIAGALLAGFGGSFTTLGLSVLGHHEGCLRYVSEGRF